MQAPPKCQCLHHNPDTNGNIHKNKRGEGQSSSITTPNAIYNMTNTQTMTEDILNLRTPSCFALIKSSTFSDTFQN